MVLILAPLRRQGTALRNLGAALFLASGALFAAGGGDAEPIVFVGDSRRHVGFYSWFIDLYNESLWYFALFTVISIPVVGMIFGVITDWMMNRVGIDLKSRKVAEH